MKTLKLNLSNLKLEQDKYLIATYGKTYVDHLTIKGFFNLIWVFIDRFDRAPLKDEFAMWMYFVADRDIFLLMVESRSALNNRDRGDRTINRSFSHYSIHNDTRYLPPKQ